MNMNNILRRAVFCAALLLAFAAGTVSAQDQGGSIWPKIYDDESYLATFESGWSEDEAVGALRNLRYSLVEHKANLPFSEFDADAFGLRARWTWVENGTFVKSAGFAIPFDKVRSLMLEHYPVLDKEYTWGLIISISGSDSTTLRTPSREAAERLGKAILVLAKARKAELAMPNPNLGAAIGTLSDAQAQAAGIRKNEGIIVHWIFRESPAEKAGILPQDILTHVNNIQLQGTDQLFAALGTAGQGGLGTLVIKGLRRSYRLENGKQVEFFAPVTFSGLVPPTGIKAAWMIEKELASAQVEKDRNAFGVFFFGYDYPMLSGTLADSLEAWQSPFNVSAGFESCTRGGSAPLAGIEIEMLLTFNENGSRMLMNSIAQFGYSFDLAPLRLNVGGRVGLSILDVMHDTDASQYYTAMGVLIGPEASLYVALDKSSWLWVRGRYAILKYTGLSGNASAPVFQGDDTLNLVSLQAGFAFRL
jgi:hypothetical protein